jgi:hypothetical protein
MDKKLSLITRIKLRTHYLMCSFCERYAKQLKYMRTVAREFPEKIGEISDAKLPTEAKERLKEALLNNSPRSLSSNDGNLVGD